MWYGIFGPGPLPSSMSQRKLARYETDDEFLSTLMPLVNLLIDMYDWQGLPDTVDQRSLELSLLWRGCACIAPYHGNLTNMGASPGGGLNVHAEFVKFFGYGWNGFSEEFENYIPGAEIVPQLQDGPGMAASGGLKTGVLIRDNPTIFPMIRPLITYCRRLANTMRRIDTVSYNLVWPGILQVDDGQVNTAKQIIQDHDDNLPVILGRRALDDIGIARIDLGAQPETLDTMWRHYDRLFSRLMEIFGIESNPTVGKAERVNTIETSANVVRTELARDQRLECRREACERINRLYGWSVSVDYDDTITERAREMARQIHDSAMMTPGSGDGSEDD